MADVLVVSPTFHPEKVGTPVYATDLVRGLAEEGHAVRVVTNQPYYPAFRRFVGYGRRTRHDVLDGTAIHRLPTIVPRRGRPMWRAVSELNMLLQVVLAILTRRVARSRHVIVVSPGVPFAVLAARLLCRRGGRLVAIVHDLQFGLAVTAGPLAGLTRMMQWVEVAALDRADVVAPLSEQMADELRRAGLGTEMRVVGLWATVEPTGRMPDPDLVLYSGNLGRKQGVEVLLDIAQRLATMRPTSRLLIRGDGSERDALVERAAARGLANVEFDGFVDEAELAASLEAASVHVVPQVAEAADHAVPSKVFNLLAVGRQVVALTPDHSTLSRLGAELDAVHCVPANDAAAAAETIAALLDAGPTDRGVAADISQRARARFGRVPALQEYLRMLGLVS
jgi:colanic acid biosynthesis glycosyl transferase WcaI